MLATIESIRCIEVPQVRGEGADLLVYEEGRAMLFTVRRVFAVRAREVSERGRHAHKQCKQLMVCLTGRCNVMVDDGKNRKSVVLARPQDALYIPASIWAEQSYREPGTILMVLCDQLYDETDYIRDYDEFLGWRAGRA